MAKSNKQKKNAIEMLEKIPYGTPEWTKQRRLITSELVAKYGDQYVLCVPGRLEKANMIIHQREVRMYMPQDKSFLLDEASMFDKNCRFVRRSTAEYNFKYKQVNVFALIEDVDGRVLVLNKGEREVHLVGGHVDFSIDAYRLSIREVLRQSIIAELEEEVIMDVDWKDHVPVMPAAIINTNAQWNDLFHLGVIYCVKLPKPMNAYKVATGEPDKHDVETFKSLDDLMKKRKKILHDWFQYIPQIQENWNLNLS